MHLLRRGSGEAILFIHGMPTSNQLWSGIIDKMCGKHACFAVDLPGLGKTPHEPYAPDYLDRLAKRIDRLRIENNVTRWHVVGHDAGSAVAVSYVYSFPQNVGCLALLSPALFPDLKPYYLLECLRKPLIGECLAPLINPIFWNIAMPRAVKNDETDCCLPDHFSESFSGLEGAWRFMRVLRWGNPSKVLAHVPGILPQITVPTLIFQGLRDPAIPQSFARRAQSLMPDCELIHVDCGHFIPMNRPGFTASRLLHFFNQRSGHHAISGILPTT